MKKTLDFQQFEGDNSVFTIDLIKNDEGNLSIDIIQKNDLHSGFLKEVSISELTNLIARLQHFYSLMHIVKPSITTKHINTSKGDKIVDFYFRNVSIEDISKILGISKLLVEKELQSRDIDIVPLEFIPQPKPKYRYWRKNK